MRGRGRGNGRGGGGAPSTDLLVRFPSRAHLSLMPKPICSPSRPTDPHPLRPINRGQASPLFKTKGKHIGSDISEPTSPKVTCAGQIKVRPKPRSRSRATSSSSKNWFTVMEEMEKLHKQRALGLKRDILHFWNALRAGLRFNMRCFGSFRGSVDYTSDEDLDDEEEEVEEEKEEEYCNSASETVLTKWFMALEEENPNDGFNKEAVEEERDGSTDQEESSATPASSVPSLNALLLMRCRSAPAKGWLEGKGDERGGGELSAKKIKEEEKEKERLVLMSYAPDFFKVSSDISKETWLVGSMNPLARSRSWKR